MLTRCLSLYFLSVVLNLSSNQAHLWSSIHYRFRDLPRNSDSEHLNIHFLQKISPGTSGWVTRIKKLFCALCCFFGRSPSCLFSCSTSRHPCHVCILDFSPWSFSWVPYSYPQLPLLGCPKNANTLHAIFSPSNILLFLYSQC